MNCTGKRCIMQHDKVDPATCECVKYCPEATPPKTNADKIRAMSDEQLAKQFALEQIYAIQMFLKGLEDEDLIDSFSLEVKRNLDDMVKEKLEWLKEEVKHDH